MNQLTEAMLLLIANDSPLGPEWFDHPLGGEWAGHRECHIGGYFLVAGEAMDVHFFWRTKRQVRNPKDEMVFEAAINKRIIYSLRVRPAPRIRKYDEPVIEK